MSAGERPAVLRRGILGGTFDPPHLAHLALATAARDRLQLDTVLFIPAGDPWRKAGRAITPAADRLAMVRATVAGLPWAEVSSIEVDRSGPTYTLDTIEALASRGGSPSDNWWFIVGEDALRDFPRWHEPQRLIARVRLAVARRAVDAPVGPLITPELRGALPGLDDRVDEVPMPRMDVSATDIRARIREGRSTEGLLPEAVRAYIDAHGLYR